MASLGIRVRDTAELESRRRRGAALLERGYRPATVARLLHVTPAAVSQWKRALRRTGADTLKAIPRSGRPPRVPGRVLSKLPILLTSEALRLGFSANLASISRVIEFVEAQWGVRYTQSGMSRLLRRYGAPPRRHPRGTQVQWV
ncbi:MAG: winged helix-turn-helix domain-containing protein [Candidatus Lutacidiplasmatales archaeon]